MTNSTDVFEKLKSLLKPYEAGLAVKTDNDSTYYLDYKSDDPAVKLEMFAAVMIKKNYVSMYYMPVYHNPELLADISSDLKKRMQGKSCFNYADKNDATLDELAKLIARTAV